MHNNNKLPLRQSRRENHEAPLRIAAVGRSRIDRCRSGCRIRHRCHRQQQRHGAYAASVPGIRKAASRHQAQLGSARRERAAAAADDRYHHRRRPVRCADHRHLRNPAVGRQELAGTARQPTGQLRRRGHLPRSSSGSVGERPPLCPAILWRKHGYLLPQGSVQGGWAADAGQADLVATRRLRQQAQPARQGPVRTLPERQGRLG